VTRPLPDVLDDEQAWTAATDEVIAAARVMVHQQGLNFTRLNFTRLIRAVVAMEKMEQAAAERIKAERAQQEGA
jgi:hypothetical protein